MVGAALTAIKGSKSFWFLAVVASREFAGARRHCEGGQLRASTCASHPQRSRRYLPLARYALGQALRSLRSRAERP